MNGEQHEGVDMKGFKAPQFGVRNNTIRYFIQRVWNRDMKFITGGATVAAVVLFIQSLSV